MHKTRGTTNHERTENLRVLVVPAQKGNHEEHQEHEEETDEAQTRCNTDFS